MEKAIGLKVDIENKKVDLEIVEFIKGDSYKVLKDYVTIISEGMNSEKILNSSIEMPSRRFGEKYFDVTCNGEFRLIKTKQDFHTTVFNDNKNETQETFLGNLLITNHDDEGETVGLSDDDIEYIKSNIQGYGSNAIVKQWNTGSVINGGY